MALLLHTADLHLGAPCAGLPPEKALMRQGELLEALRRAVRLADERGAELLLLAGDLFDSPQPPPDLARAAARILSGCRAEVFVAPGNHDYFAPAGPYGQDLWGPNVHIFRTRTLQAVPLEELNATVYGAAFLSPSQTESPLKGFRCPQDGRTHLLVLHCDVNARDSQYCPVTGAELEEAGFHYAALGHVHQATVPPLRAGETVYAYSGCPEGRGFDELGERGVLLGQVTQEECRLEFVPTAARRYLELPLHLRRDTDPAAALDRALTPRMAQDLLRVEFRGEQETPVELNSMQAQFEGRVFSLSLRDETSPPVDLWARAGEQTLRGQYLEELRERLEKARGAEKRAALELAARFGLAALDNTRPPEEEESEW